MTSGHGVVSALVERMAAQYPAQGQISPFGSAVFFNGLHRVLRTGRRKPAARRVQGRQIRPVKANQPKQNPLRHTAQAAHGSPPLRNGPSRECQGVPGAAAPRFSSFARSSSFCISRVMAAWGSFTIDVRAMNTYLPHFMRVRRRRTSSRRQRRMRLRVTALPTLPETEKPIFRSRPFRWISTRLREGQALPRRYT